jgi:hypothetical protein
MLRTWIRRFWVGFDLLAIALAVYVAAETTPLGGYLADRARLALHLSPRSRSIASYFDTRHPDPSRGRPELLAALPPPDSPEAVRAKTLGNAGARLTPAAPGLEAAARGSRGAGRRGPAAATGADE